MRSPTEITSAALLQATRVDDHSLTFTGLRGDPSRHLSCTALIDALTALSPAPRDEGTVDLLLARGDHGERELPQSARLTIEGGLEGDRWARQDKYGTDHQLATTRTSFASVIANGQHLELHGDNLFLDLDLSRDNLPSGSIVRVGQALTCVTEVAHNGCKKWVQRFGLDAMQLNMTPPYQHLRLRGLYLRVLEAGVVHVGDRAVVLERGKN